MCPKDPSSGKFEFLLNAGVAVFSLVLSVTIYFVWLHEPKESGPSLHDPLPQGALPVSNRLAVLGGHGTLLLVDPVSGERRLLTNEGQRCTDPTWSPDGAYIAYVERHGRGWNGIGAVAVHDGTAVTLLSPQGIRPFALNWSSDGGYIAYSIRGYGRLTASILGVTADTPFHAEAPLGASAVTWSDDGHTLLWIYDNEIRLAEVGRSLKTITTAPNVGYTDAPAWAPGSQNFVRTRELDGRPVLAMERSVDQERPLAFPLDGDIGIVSSPDHSHLAIIEWAQTRRRVPAGQVTVLSLVDGGDTRKFPLAALAVQWSPDSRYLAILTRSSTTGSDEQARYHILDTDLPLKHAVWWILDLESGESFPLVSFDPNEWFYFAIRSVRRCSGVYRFWDPTGTRFVVPAQDAGSGASTIWVLDVFGSEPPRPLGEGYFATWSWK